MSDIIVTVWRTRVVGGIVQAPSEQVTLSIRDRNGDGLIDFKEWADASGNTVGHNAGDDTGGILWRGDTTGNKAAGYLYTSTPYQQGDNLSPVLRSIKQNFRPIDPDALSICFLEGTRIATPTGDRPVEEIRPGDRVLTRDAGAQPVVWVGSSFVNAVRLGRAPQLRPVRIARGALGDGLPHRGLHLSAQHRVLIRDAEGHEGLAAARHLAQAGMAGVTVVRKPGVFRLFHLALAQHHILTAEGAAVESFYAGPMALAALPPLDRVRLMTALPALAQPGEGMTPARPFLTRPQVAAAVARQTGDVAPQSAPCISRRREAVRSNSKLPSPSA